MKFLFINDNAGLLGSWKAFFDNSNVAFAECHSVKDALRAIAKHKPDVIFLDNSLTEYGDEGLEIADRVKGVKIYSTTTNDSIMPEYQKRGIKNVSKMDLNKLKSIITGKK